MAALDYSAKVVDHFLHPRHLGVIQESEIDPAAERLVVCDAGQITRGDALRLALRIRISGESIVDARFQNMGTGMPIASASCLCSTIIGMSLTQALEVSAEDLDRELDGLPELKHKRAVLVLDALDSAARKFRGQPPRESGPPGAAPLCYCFQVPEVVVERAIRLRGLKTIDGIIEATRAGAGCHTCHPDLQAVLDRCSRGEYKVHIPPVDYDAYLRIFATAAPSAEELARNPPPPPERTAKIAPDGFVYPERSPAAEAAKQQPAPKLPAKPWREMTYPERVQRIEDVLARDLRPAIQSDGGDIKLLDLKENSVRVSLHGHCKSCHSASSTLKMGVEKRLREIVWPELEIEEVFE